MYAFVKIQRESVHRFFSIEVVKYNTFFFFWNHHHHHPFNATIIKRHYLEIRNTIEWEEKLCYRGEGTKM